MCSDQLVQKVFWDETKAVFGAQWRSRHEHDGLDKDGDFLPGVFGPCQMPPSEQRGRPALPP